MNTYGEVVFTRHEDGFSVDRADDTTLIAADLMNQLPSGPMDLVFVGNVTCSLATCRGNHTGRCYAKSLVRITSRHGEVYDYRIGLYVPEFEAWEAFREKPEIITHRPNPIFTEPQHDSDIW